MGPPTAHHPQNDEVNDQQRLPESAVRRQWLHRALAWPLAGLTGCASGPWPDVPAGAGSSSARARLQECADAHGLAAWRGLHDINIGHRSVWSAGTRQPQMAWAGAAYRAQSQERLLPAAGLLAQQHQGQAGQQQVLRRQGAPAAPARPAAPAAPVGPDQPGTGDVTVWLNHARSADQEVRAAAALQADASLLLLAGPMALAGFAGPVNWGPPETLDSRRCDQLLLDRVPGLGFSPSDRLALFVDRDLGLLRRLHRSLDGLHSTAGMLVEVDFFDHFNQHGIWWPRRFAERLRQPVADLQWRDARLTGLDVNRGYGPDDISGALFTGAAAAPARALPAG